MHNIYFPFYSFSVLVHPVVMFLGNQLVHHLGQMSCQPLFKQSKLSLRDEREAHAGTGPAVFVHHVSHPAVYMNQDRSSRKLESNGYLLVRLHWLWALERQATSAEVNNSSFYLSHSNKVCSYRNVNHIAC